MSKEVYIKVLEMLRQLRLNHSSDVRECQVELRFLKLNEEKAQPIKELLTTKENQLASSKETVQKIESQFEPLDVDPRSTDNYF
ncbi:unnamed protein product [Coregonus sp. 'balchen']|nr:unnamed protein product [Coregonus sp. 'balchen']